MDGTKIEKFEFICLNCKKNQRQYQVLLHVDWEKRYYMITCFTCKSIEAFDEFGEKVKLQKEKSKLLVN